MDEERRAELTARLLGKPGSKAEKEQRVLDLLEWSLADFVPIDAKSIGELRAGILLRKPDTWPAYIQASTHDRWAWETLTGLVRIHRKRARAHSTEVVLPPPLSGWVLKVASGSLSRPKWPARPKLLEHRDITIAKAIQRLHDLGRPYAPPSENTACHLVADRLGWSVNSVRDIWKAQQGRLRHLRSDVPDSFDLDDIPRTNAP